MSGNFQSSGLRQKVDQLMDILWAGGVNNPMDSIEQISYLLFLRLLTEKDELLAEKEKGRGSFSREAEAVSAVSGGGPTVGACDPRPGDPPPAAAKQWCRRDNCAARTVARLPTRLRFGTVPQRFVKRIRQKNEAVQIK
jgi:hypothetical protein